MTNYDTAFPQLDKIDNTMIMTDLLEDLSATILKYNNNGSDDDDNDEKLCELFEKLNYILSKIAMADISKITDMIIFCRSITNGLGHRQLTYMMLHALYLYYPEVAVDCLKHIITTDGCGSWRDITGLCQFIKVKRTSIPLHLSAFQTPKVTLPFNSFSPTKSAFKMEKGLRSPYFEGTSIHCVSIRSNNFINAAIQMMNQQLMKDLIAMSSLENQNKTLSNACKWAPRENSQFSWLFERMAIDWAKTHHSYILRSATKISHQRTVASIPSISYKAEIKCRMIYRKVVSSLTKKLGVFECYQCAKSWTDGLEYINVNTLVKNLPGLINDDLLDLGVLDSIINKVKHSSYCSHSIVKITVCIDNNVFLGQVVDGLDNGSHILGKYVKYALDSIANNNTNMKSILDKIWSKILEHCYKFTDIDDKLIPIVHVENAHSINDCTFQRAIGRACLIVLAAKVWSYRKNNLNLVKGIIIAGNQPTWINLEKCMRFTECIEAFKGAAPPV